MAEIPRLIAVHMTDEELIAKAREEAKRCGVLDEDLKEPNVRKAAVVTFSSTRFRGQAKLYLDASTGDFLSGEFSPEFQTRTRPKGREFSKRAQDVLAFANHEAERQGCKHIGSDHLLLAVLAIGGGAGSEVLSAVGLSVEAVRKTIEDMGSPAEHAPNGYGPSMRGILRASSDHAATLDHSEIEPDHFVLGLLDEVDGPASRVLRHHRLDVAQAKASLLRRLSSSSS